MWKPILPMPVLYKEWKRHNLPIRELTDGLACALEKGWIRKDADSEAWPLTEPGYNHAIGSYFYRSGMSVSSIDDTPESHQAILSREGDQE
jgi:hypothetical protein